MLRTVLLVVALFSVAFACDCRPRDPQAKFCLSDAVGVFRIFKQIPNSANNTLLLRHYSGPKIVFKSVAGKDGGVQQPNPEYVTVIRTTSQSAACGVTWLKEEREYLLNGAYDYERRTLTLIGSCSQIAPSEWSSVPADIKKALEDGTYKCPSSVLPPDSVA